MAPVSSYLKAFVAASAVGIAIRQTGTFVPRPGNFPKTGDDTIAGGIFCISLGDLGTYLARAGNPGGSTSEAPRGAGQATSGSGPYPAQAFLDPALPKHTIFAPKVPPPNNVSLPLITWGNGGCGTDPNSFKNFLIEVASHGYVIAAVGRQGGIGQSQTTVQNHRDGVDWGYSGKASKYGNVNTTAITTMGQSCGGLEAMSTAYHDERVKRIVMLNIAIFQDERRYLLQEINVPVAYFIGGKTDMGYPNAEKDYKLLNAGLPVYKANLDTGHGGTYSATNGGKFGKAVVNYLQWQWRGDAKAKAILLDANSAGSLVSDKWTVEHKNWT
ncbi:hypothetical protein B0T14DRAFT_89201 [Immersiella caudata]|uniref:Uncharacterized protein n=1 Tax=Immersiella caudata TaxID=314043 RepID=A0AA39X2G6_9PEZI|nr:hypothetical protein B0T14DRAFT_89201 [Immersiella caudata]